MDNEIQELVEKYGWDLVTKAGAFLMTPARCDRIEHLFDQRLSSLELIFESPADIHNVMASLRSAEALGIWKASVIETERKIRGKTARGADQWMWVRKYGSIEEVPSDMHLAGAVVPQEGVLLLDEVPVDKPLAVIFGNEDRGLSEEAKVRCDFLFSIPMYGMVESFNVSVAVAISLYTLSQKRRKVIGGLGDMSGKERQKERVFAYARTVGLEKLCAVLHSGRG